ncbi:MAG: ATPase [Lentisphaerae bacterium RIFOXYC12_FULL_60_16]|nr:MAG: ATPase [Lentisphaerae bacterium RIFOXYC12_FULL_60_16]
MPFFPFDLNSAAKDPYYAGFVAAVDTRKVMLDVPDDSLERISVGKLAVLPIPQPDAWLVGFIDRVVCKAQYVAGPSDDSEAVGGKDNQGQLMPMLTQGNAVTITLVGAIQRQTNSGGKIGYRFTRSLISVPDVHASCFVLREKALETFMGLLAKAGDTEHALAVGHYTLDPTATAYLDGDRFFQRHAALLGSTGSGKSWTVATILERAARLPSANLIVLDLHGEYGQLGYARQLRVPGPDDLDSPAPGLLFLPYWLMNAEELIAMFVDSGEFTAHNQAMVLQREVEKGKRLFIEQQAKKDILPALTVDSPVPFALEDVIATIAELNSEMTQGARGLKQGDFHGQFGRFLARVDRKLKDKRYGFLFQTPKALHSYDAFHALARQLLDFAEDNARIKVIDFSEVPTDALPIMLGIVARLVYYLQFWMPKEKRHPVALICDEAHIYLPRDGTNPNEKRAIACFEKVAKEGRKYGVSLVIVSQRPSDVNDTILSQCNNVVALRLTNAADQAVVNRLMPESLTALLEMLPILDVGEALVVGDAVLLPSRIRMNPPTEKPISATIDFWTEWSAPDKKPDWELAAENMRRQRRRSS